MIHCSLVGLERVESVNRKIKIYLVGVFLGCLLLMVLPKPFGKSRKSDRPSAAGGHGIYPITVNDGYGREVTLKLAPGRIISLAPSVTEILYAIGMGERLVANTKFDRYPPEAANLYKIGDMRHPNLEMMVQLRAGLVLGTVLSPASLYERMEAAGLTAVALAHTDWEGVLADIGTVGKLVGAPGEALRAIRELRAKRDRILEKINSEGRKPAQRVALLYDLEKLYSAGSGSWAGDLIELCHAENIAAGLPSAWPQLSLEGFLKSDPQVVIVAVGESLAARQAATRAIQALKEDAVWKQISAVRNGRVAMVPKSYFDVPGPRMVNALEEVARAIHPEAFSAQSGQVP